jgi:WD40 repeat protein
MMRQVTYKRPVRIKHWALGIVGTVAVCLAAGRLLSADKAPVVQKPAKVETQAKDRHGDPLPDGALARLGTVRWRYNATSIAYSPDGKLLAAGSADNQIRIIDPATGKELRRLAGHQPRTYNAPRQPRSATDILVKAVGEGNVTTVAFAADNKTLASGGWDGFVRLWDATTGEELRQIFAHKAMVTTVVFSQDGKTLASRGGIDGTVRLWDPATGNKRRTFDGLQKANPWRFNRDSALAISPDNKTIAAGDANVIHFWDIASGKESRKLDAHRVCLSLAFSRDGTLLASGGVDPGKDQHSLRIWDIAKGKELRRCKLPKNEPPISIAFAPDGKYLAAVIEEDDLHIFAVATGQPVHRLKHYWASRVAYAPDGRTLTSARGPTLRRWDATTGKELAQEFAGHQAGVAAVAVSPDGKMVASGGDNIRLWARATGKPIRRIEVKGYVAALAFSKDGKKLASGGRDRMARLWDVDSGKLVQVLKGAKHMLCGVALSPDGKLLAAGDAQATMRVWDVDTGKEKYQFDMKSGTENLSLAFSPDGKKLACAGAWNDSSFLPPGGINIQGVHMTRKEGYLVLLWDMATGKEARRFAGLRDKIKSVAFAPDGKILAAASRDGRIAFWETDTGKDLLYIMAHPKHSDVAHTSSPSVAFAPDGKTLASASTDKTIRLWDVATAKERGRFQTPDVGFTTLAFAPDGKTVVSGSADSTVLVWDVKAADAGKPKGQPNVILIGD